MKFLNKLILQSDKSNKYKHHIPGNIVMYIGNDGIKFYAILAREKHDMINTAMVANPKLEISPRATTRSFHMSSVNVLNVDEWICIQSEFIELLCETADDRLQRFIDTNK